MPPSCQHAISLEDLFRGVSKSSTLSTAASLTLKANPFKAFVPEVPSAAHLHDPDYVTSLERKLLVDEASNDKKGHTRLFHERMPLGNSLSSAELDKLLETSAAITAGLQGVLSTVGGQKRQHTDAAAMLRSRGRQPDDRLQGRVKKLKEASAAAPDAPVWLDSRRGSLAENMDEDRLVSLVLDGEHKPVYRTSVRTEARAAVKGSDDEDDAVVRQVYEGFLMRIKLMYFWDRIARATTRLRGQLDMMEIAKDIPWPEERIHVRPKTATDSITPQRREMLRCLAEGGKSTDDVRRRLRSLVGTLEAKWQVAALTLTSLYQRVPKHQLLERQLTRYEMQFSKEVMQLQEAVRSGRSDVQKGSCSRFEAVYEKLRWFYTHLLSSRLQVEVAHRAAKEAEKEAEEQKALIPDAIALSQLFLSPRVSQSTVPTFEIDHDKHAAGAQLVADDKIWQLIAATGLDFKSPDLKKLLAKIYIRGGQRRRSTRTGLLESYTERDTGERRPADEAGEDDRSLGQLSVQASPLLSGAVLQLSRSGATSPVSLSFAGPTPLGSKPRADDEESEATSTLSYHMLEESAGPQKQQELLEVALASRSGMFAVSEALRRSKGTGDRERVYANLIEKQELTRLELVDKVATQQTIVDVFQEEIGQVLHAATTITDEEFEEARQEMVRQSRLLTARSRTKGLVDEAASAGLVSAVSLLVPEEENESSSSASTHVDAAAVQQGQQDSRGAQVEARRQTQDTEQQQGQKEPGQPDMAEVEPRPQGPQPKPPVLPEAALSRGRPSSAASLGTSAASVAMSISPSALLKDLPEKLESQSLQDDTIGTVRALAVMWRQVRDTSERFYANASRLVEETVAAGGEASRTLYTLLDNARRNCSALPNVESFEKHLEQILAVPLPKDCSTRSPATDGAASEAEIKMMVARAVPHNIRTAVKHATNAIDTSALSVGEIKRPLASWIEMLKQTPLAMNDELASRIREGDAGQPPLLAKSGGKKAAKKAPAKKPPPPAIDTEPAEEAQEAVTEMEPVVAEIKWDEMSPRRRADFDNMTVVVDNLRRIRDQLQRKAEIDQTIDLAKPTMEPPKRKKTRTGTVTLAGSAGKVPSKESVLGPKRPSPKAKLAQQPTLFVALGAQSTSFFTDNPRPEVTLLLDQKAGLKEQVGDLQRRLADLESALASRASMEAQAPTAVASTLSGRADKARPDSGPRHGPAPLGSRRVAEPAPSVPKSPAERGQAQQQTARGRTPIAPSETVGAVPKPKAREGVRAARSDKEGARKAEPRRSPQREPSTQDRSRDDDDGRSTATARGRKDMERQLKQQQQQQKSPPLSLKAVAVGERAARTLPQQPPSKPAAVAAPTHTPGTATPSRSSPEGQRHGRERNRTPDTDGKRAAQEEPKFMSEDDQHFPNLSEDMRRIKAEMLKGAGVTSAQWVKSSVKRRRVARWVVKQRKTLKVRLLLAQGLLNKFLLRQIDQATARSFKKMLDGGGKEKDFGEERRALAVRIGDISRLCDFWRGRLDILGEAVQYGFADILEFQKAKKDGTLRPLQDVYGMPVPPKVAAAKATIKALRPTALSARLRRVPVTGLGESRISHVTEETIELESPVPQRPQDRPGRGSSRLHSPMKKSPKASPSIYRRSRRRVRRSLTQGDMDAAKLHQQLQQQLALRRGDTATPQYQLTLVTRALETSKGGLRRSSSLGDMDGLRKTRGRLKRRHSSGLRSASSRGSSCVSPAPVLPHTLAGQLKGVSRSQTVTALGSRRHSFAHSGRSSRRSVSSRRSYQGGQSEDGSRRSSVCSAEGEKAYVRTRRRARSVIFGRRPTGLDDLIASHSRTSTPEPEKTEVDKASIINQHLQKIFPEAVEKGSPKSPQSLSQAMIKYMAREKAERHLLKEWLDRIPELNWQVREGLFTELMAKEERLIADFAKKGLSFTSVKFATAERVLALLRMELINIHNAVDQQQQQTPVLDRIRVPDQVTEKLQQMYDVFLQKVTAKEEAQRRAEEMKQRALLLKQQLQNIRFSSAADSVAVQADRADIPDRLDKADETDKAIDQAAPATPAKGSTKSSPKMSPPRVRTPGPIASRKSSRPSTAAPRRAVAEAGGSGEAAAEAPADKTSLGLLYAIGGESDDALSDVETPRVAAPVTDQDTAEEQEAREQALREERRRQVRNAFLSTYFAAWRLYVEMQKQGVRMPPDDEDEMAIGRPSTTKRKSQSQRKKKAASERTSQRLLFSLFPPDADESDEEDPFANEDLQPLIHVDEDDSDVSQHGDTEAHRLSRRVIRVGDVEFELDKKQYVALRQRRDDRMLVLNREYGNMAVATDNRRVQAIREVANVIKSEIQEELREAAMSWKRKDSFSRVIEHEDQMRLTSQRASRKSTAPVVAVSSQPRTPFSPQGLHSSRTSQRGSLHNIWASPEQMTPPRTAPTPHTQQMRQQGYPGSVTLAKPDTKDAVADADAAVQDKQRRAMRRSSTHGIIMSIMDEQDTKSQKAEPKVSINEKVLEHRVMIDDSESAGSATDISMRHHQAIEPVASTTKELPKQDKKRPRWSDSFTPFQPVQAQSMAADTREAQRSAPRPRTTDARPPSSSIYPHVSETRPAEVYATLAKPTSRGRGYGNLPSPSPARFTYKKRALRASRVQMRRMSGGPLRVATIGVSTGSRIAKRHRGFLTRHFTSLSRTAGAILKGGLLNAQGALQAQRRKVHCKRRKFSATYPDVHAHYHSLIHSLEDLVNEAVASLCVSPSLSLRRRAPLKMERSSKPEPLAHSDGRPASARDRYSMPGQKPLVLHATPSLPQVKKSSPAQAVIDHTTKKPSVVHFLSPHEPPPLPTKRLPVTPEPHHVSETRPAEVHAMKSALDLPPAWRALDRQPFASPDTERWAHVKGDGRQPLGGPQSHAADLTGDRKHPPKTGLRPAPAVPRAPPERPASPAAPLMVRPFVEADTARKRARDESVESKGEKQAAVGGSESQPDLSLGVPAPAALSVEQHVVPPSLLQRARVLRPSGTRRHATATAATDRQGDQLVVTSTTGRDKGRGQEDINAFHGGPILGRRHPSLTALTERREDDGVEGGRYGLAVSLHPAALQAGPLTERTPRRTVFKDISARPAERRESAKASLKVVSSLPLAVSVDRGVRALLQAPKEQEAGSTDHQVSPQRPDKSKAKQEGTAIATAAAQPTIDDFATLLKWMMVRQRGRGEVGELEYPPAVVPSSLRGHVSPASVLDREDSMRSETVHLPPLSPPGTDVTRETQQDTSIEKKGGQQGLVSPGKRLDAKKLLHAARQYVQSGFATSALHQLLQAGCASSQ
ncbi:unnamed protein product [Vitrella brassicaformis CCMP3155]|uniref:Uncharacterized protein n=4 Tax=Vitrella brassicaformis TaxID=1169539 RepID=A0A0G4G7M0_VITBC|nr:unnamed protein product [Vitrella brassicaformis CCMP3155]|eukprot:CEM24694.1 unnamed protein product [Vitrella brassicaformis CCMP3155]